MSRPVMAAVVGLAAVLLGAWLGASERSTPLPGIASQPAAPESPTIDVHVAGWVVAPGVVELAEGSLTVDAVEAAGGLRPGAVSEGINLAAALQDGQQVFVPGPERESAGGSAGDGLVPINRADAAELETLPGVGPVLAERIVAHREANGPFGEAEDLLDVPGIGESKLGTLRDLIAVP